MVVKIRKNFCLTFDIEEFDLPKNITEEEIYATSFEGTKNILNLLRKQGIKATFFITTKFTSKYPNLVREISKEHEIGSHGYAHNHEYKKLPEQTAYEFIKKSKEAIERVTKKEIQGFRAPRMKLVEPRILKKSGFKYDASLLPALIPGRYDDFLKPRKIHPKEGITIVPTSVTPIIKVPLMWYGFRNFGLGYAKTCTLLSSLNNTYASIYFHSWEFADIAKYNLPNDIKRNAGKKLEVMLVDYIRWCRKRYDFSTISEMIKKNHETAEAL